MSRTKLLTIAIIGLLLLNLGTLTFMFLQNSHHDLMHGSKDKEQGPKYIIIARMHFNQTQKLKYDDLVEEHRRGSRELHEESKALHDELFVLLKEREIDVAKKKTLIAQIAENQAKMERLNFDHFHDIKSLCKGVQLKYYDELVDDLGRLFSPKHPPK